MWFCDTFYWMLPSFSLESEQVSMEASPTPWSGATSPRFLTMPSILLCLSLLSPPCHGDHDCTWPSSTPRSLVMLFFYPRGPPSTVPPSSNVSLTVLLFLSDRSYLSLLRKHLWSVIRQRLCAPYALSGPSFVLAVPLRYLSSGVGP
jgi:hypothetical protein